MLAGQASTLPKNEEIAAMRSLLTARRSAVKARTAAMNQIRDMLITAPAELRERYRPLSAKDQLKALSACRPWKRTGIDCAVLTSLRLLAKRHEFLANQITELEDDLRGPGGPDQPHAHVCLRGRPCDRGPTAHHRRRQPTAARQ